MLLCKERCRYEQSDLVANRSKSPGAFHFPAFVDVGPDGTVYVSDGMNFRIQAFDANGAYLFHFGFHGDTPGGFARPKDLAIDSEGQVYVVDAAFNNIQIFTAKGELLLAFGAIGSGLQGVTYVLDEPTIGLHERDTLRLIALLRRLRDDGNQVIVVEHDAEVIRSADHIIDLGPEGGHKGGKVVAQGTPEKVARSKKSYTGKALKEVL